MSHRTERLRRGTFAQRVIVLVALSIAALSFGVVPASSAAGAEQQGAALLAHLQNGQTSCGKLSSSDFALMGEYEMGRIMGSTAAQDAMNAQMHASTGASGQQLAYRFMGERLGGCATGNGPVSYGTMMGMMGTSEMGASYNSANSGNGYSSSMMGNYGSSNGGMGMAAIAAIVIGSLLLLAMIALLATRRTPRGRTRPKTT